MTPSEIAPSKAFPETSAAAPALPAAAAKPGVLSRWLAPTVGDFLFILVIVFAFLAPPEGWQRLFLDGDTGLHIRTGDLILTTGAVPTTDPFSFSRPGGTWYAFEWGSEVIYSLLHHSMGLKGLALITGVVLSATYALLFLFSIWCGANGAISLVFALAAASATTIHFHARPHVFTLLLFVIALWMLERDRRKPDRWLWLLIPIATVWANLHGGFMMLPVVIGLFFLGDWIEVRRFPAKLFALGAACSLATLINPYGYRLHQHILETMGAQWLMNLVDEFHSPSFRGEAMTLFMAALFAGLATLGHLAGKRRFREVFLILFLAWASLTSVRHAPLFLLAALPVVALELTALWKGAVAGLPRQSVLRILDEVAEKISAGRCGFSVWSGAFVAFLALSPSLAWPTDFDKTLFPTQLITRNTAILTAGRLFTTDQWNDYLVYRYYPHQRVFIDGRHNYYGENLVRDYSGLIQGGPGWRKSMEHYRFDRALVPAGAALVSLLRTAPDWREADSDTQAVLFVKGQPVSGDSRKDASGSTTSGALVRTR